MKRVAKNGFTLVELLVVLGIALLLAALILPTVKSLLTERKTSQAAIMLKNYLEAARARAIGKNRSVAVVLERLSGRVADLDDNGIINLADAVNPNYATPRFNSATAAGIAVASRTTYSPDTNFIPYNTCIRLSMAEEPLPVTHKTIASAVNIQTQAVVAMLPTTDYVGGEVLADGDQAAWAMLSKPEERTFSVTLPYAGTIPDANIAQLLGQYLVAGNEISFGESSQRFTIASPSLSQTHQNYESRDSMGRIWFSIYNERGAIALNEQALRSYANINLPTTTSTSTAFRIYQKPKPIYAQSVQLPKGSCIDLSLSGFANNRPGLSGPIGLADYRVRFASDWVIAGSSGVPAPEELRPIYLVFAPDGSFSRVYANEQAGAQSIRIDAVDDVFLHIGKIDQVNMPIAAGSVRDRAGLEAAVAADVKQNLVDASSYIVRVSPKSGAITAAPLQLRPYAPGDGNTLFDIIGNSRNGTFSSTATGQ
jgi:prepilin-type N-terminal cleavage/methylation domain-containing protein